MQEVAQSNLERVQGHDLSWHLVQSQALDHSPLLMLHQVKVGLQDQA